MNSNIEGAPTASVSPSAERAIPAHLVVACAARRLLDSISARWRDWRDPDERDVQRALRRRFRPWKGPWQVRSAFALLLLAGWGGAAVACWLGWRFWSGLPSYDLRAHWLIVERVEYYVLLAITIGVPIATFSYLALATRWARKEDVEALPEWGRRTTLACASWGGDALALSIAPVVIACQAGQLAWWFLPQSHNPLAGAIDAIQEGSGFLLALGISITASRRLAVKLLSGQTPAWESIVAAALLVYGLRVFAIFRFN